MALTTILRTAYAVLVLLVALQILLPLIVAQENALTANITTINVTVALDVNVTVEDKKKKPKGDQDNSKDGGDNCYNCTYINNGATTHLASSALLPMGLSFLASLVLNSRDSTRWEQGPLMRF
ncbi:hypothetical protein SLS58_000308 [Diplodia intermedia]|uniref:Uncharacterized protein n=1 Tax=Diplodia intermedia TaxID=856260 RepID=A0ABR3U5K1_9PEZI